MTGDQLLALMIRGQASIAGRLDAILAALVQAAGSPLRSPLPRAKGVRGIPDVQPGSLAITTATVQVLPADPTRRRILFSTPGTTSFVVGPTSLVASSPATGILISNQFQSYLLVTEEAWGEFVRMPWYAACTSFNGTMIWVVETIK